MILGFKKQFVPKIIEGSKIHTIREDKHDRWKVGRKIQFATGVRTSYYNQFHEAECIRVQSIEIRWVDVELTTTASSKKNNYPVANIYIDGIYFDPYAIAENDGFNSSEEFLKWFDKDFSGKIIHWTDYKYH